MELHQVIDAFDYRIVDGSEYLWKCYPNARFINFESDAAYASVIHCTTSRVVYEVMIDSKNSDESVYRWINLNFLDAYLAECIERNVKSTIAWDEVKFTENDPDEFLIKAVEVFNSKGTAG